MIDTSSWRHRPTNAGTTTGATALKAGATALLLLSLFGCAGSSQQTADTTLTPPPEEGTQTEQSGRSMTLPPSQFSLQFNAAERSLAQFNWMQASVALQDLPVDELAPDDRTYRAYLDARIAYVRGDQTGALRQLNNLNDPQIHPALLYRIASFKHHILELQGAHLESAQLADQILLLVPAEAAPTWKRNLWRNLQRGTDAQLRAALLLDAWAPRWQHWLELALISRTNTFTLVDELQRWRDANPDHPGANPLPGGLYLLEEPRAQRIALLLPLSGNLAVAGKAVLDGYLAAYFSARAAGRAPYELRVLDQDNYASADTAYEEAVSLGVSLVVGPLSKRGVADLAVRVDRPVPILALNRVENILPATGSALVQFSLAPEDEARRVADMAFGQGARTALVITPAGAWGEKVAGAMRERWVALGGTVTASAGYNSQEDYTSSLKEALGLSGSEQRARRVRDMLATNIEFTPRRRDDPDAVFLLSRNGSEARSIKPLLAYLFAGDLPVYALSSIYDGVPDDRNRDLNGIHMVATPWLLGASPGLRVAIAAGSNGRPMYTRFNALGADAFLLQTEFARLGSGADALLRGNTGLLSMDSNLQIQRELSAATFDGGGIQAQ